VTATVSAYPDPSANFIYNLLFADDPEPFRPAGEGRLAALFAEPPDIAVLTALATDESVESRLRVLAFSRLRQAGAAPPADVPLLGVVVEVGLDGGLDTLATYTDGRVRYINQAGGMSIVETPELIAAQVGQLIEAGRALAASLTDAAGERSAPPGPGAVRLTLLVGDRRRVAEGTFESFGTDTAAGPVLAAALALLGGIMAMQPGLNPPAADAGG
jgi:hypothetical protein